MISPKEAYNNIVAAYPDMQILSAVNYNTQYYVFSLDDKTNKNNYNHPYYAVNKSNGAIVGFVPDDLEEYLEAVEKRSFDFSDVPDGYMK